MDALTPDRPPPDAVESRRLAALHDLRILDTPPEPHFDAVCRTARRLFGVENAYVSFIDADRQWLKTPCEPLPRERPRRGTICEFTIGSDAVHVVPDTLADPASPTARSRARPTTSASTRALPSSSPTDTASARCA